MVTKSAVMKMLVTPGSESRSPTKASSGSLPLVWVVGPPTGVPTENRIALGFGDGLTVTAIALARVIGWR